MASGEGSTRAAGAAAAGRRANTARTNGINSRPNTIQTDAPSVGGAAGTGGALPPDTATSLGAAPVVPVAALVSANGGSSDSEGGTGRDGALLGMVFWVAGRVSRARSPASTRPSTARSRIGAACCPAGRATRAWWCGWCTWSRK